jgi:CheY-like chemotaxis protein
MTPCLCRPLVLLVDDSPELGTIVAWLGERAGYTTICRPDVSSAWDYLREERPDLILLDVHLPGDEGLELCRRARATPHLADFPIALFSQWSQSPDIVAGLDAGVDFLVSKDLVSRPAEWRGRLAEILPAEHGQRRNHSLGWKLEANPPPVPSPWVATLNHALDQPCWRKIDSEVLRQVLRRALGHVFPGGEARDWIGPEGWSLHPEQTPPHDIAIALVASLAEQVWRLFGTEASTPYWGVLASVIPGQPETVPR